MINPIASLLLERNQQVYTHQSLVGAQQAVQQTTQIGPLASSRSSKVVTSPPVAIASARQGEPSNAFPQPMPIVASAQAATNLAEGFAAYRGLIADSGKGQMSGQGQMTGMAPYQERPNMSHGPSETDHRRTEANHVQVGHGRSEARHGRSEASRDRAQLVDVSTYLDKSHNPRNHHHQTTQSPPMVMEVGRPVDKQSGAVRPLGMLSSGRSDISLQRSMERANSIQSEQIVPRPQLDMARVDRPLVQTNDSRPTTYPPISTRQKRMIEGERRQKHTGPAHPLKRDHLVNPLPFQERLGSVNPPLGEVYYSSRLLDTSNPQGGQLAGQTFDRMYFERKSVDRHSLDRQSLDRQSFDRQSFDRQSLDRYSAPLASSPTPGQTAAPMVGVNTGEATPIAATAFAAWTSGSERPFNDDGFSGSRTTTTRTSGPVTTTVTTTQGVGPTTVTSYEGRSLAAPHTTERLSTVERTPIVVNYAETNRPGAAAVEPLMQSPLAGGRDKKAMPGEASNPKTGHFAGCKCCKCRGNCKSWLLD